MRCIRVVTACRGVMVGPKGPWLGSGGVLVGSKKIVQGV